MRVVAWTTAARMRGRQEEIGAIRQQLQVGTVLTGSVRIAGPSLRVRSQLIDSETGVYLWSETFDRQMQDVFAIQEEIARAIVRTLRVQLAALVSSAAPVPGRAPTLVGSRASRSVVKDFAAGARTSHNSQAGHTNGRKKCSVMMTLAAS
jgi:hypothetical protein